MRGIIIEQIPNKSIKIETIGRNVFFFELDEVEKITKEISPDFTNNRSVKIKKNRPSKRGYIGVSLSLSNPVGEFKSSNLDLANSGLQINLINFGYRFTSHIGVAFTWFGAANPMLNDNYTAPWTYGGLMLGPLISFPLSSSAELDFRPMIGYSAARSPEFTVFNSQSQPLVFGGDEGESLAFNIGSVLRYNFGSKTALFFSLDYFNTRPSFAENTYNQRIQTITFGVGLAFRIN